MAVEMGAEHKLDLTSDVTHMVVGELQTPKYKYVAKEREDVQCLLTEWIYAVREQFLTGGDVAVQELEQKYKVPTFWGLVICITGFEDPEQRKEMEVQITQHGGDYRGDLRKDCTHLVCFSPAGAKYSSAKAWGIPTVSIEWLSMSIQRGMVLDEDYFQPTMPPEERGRGAWKRRVSSYVESLKRERSQSQLGRARKLRRTASERFSSDNVWGDIVSGASSPALPAEASFAAALGAGPSVQSNNRTAGNPQRKLVRSESLMNPLRPPSQEEPAVPKAPARRGIFHNKRFLIYGFDERRVKLLEQHLKAQDAVTCDVAASKLQLGNGSSFHSPLLTIVPYTAKSNDLDSNPEVPRQERVTELWLEKCLHEKQYILPESGAIYTPFTHPIPGLEALSICSTGFEGVDLMHLSKVIKSLGATYQEGLNPSTSLLLSRDSSLSRSKTRHAFQWKIPVVEVTWLWDTIKAGEYKPWDSYLMHPQLQNHEDGGGSKIDEGNRISASTEAKPIPQRRLLGRTLNGSDGSDMKKPLEPAIKDSFARASSVTEADTGNESESVSALPDRQVLSEVWRATDSLPISEPLQEVSPNIPRPSSRSPHKKDNVQVTTEMQKINGEQITTALTSLLTMAREQRASPARKPRRLLGRARSDLSTRSLGSRAESVDSLNTDGVGTPLEPAFKYSPSKSKAQAQARSRRQSEVENTKESLTAELLLSHEELEERERQMAEEQTPVMTQVGYDDSEAGVWRERLSRKMTGADDNQPPSPEVERELENARRRHVLRDEGGQSVSTRTRHNKGS